MIVTSLSADLASRYESVKQANLAEYKITPALFLDRFNNMKRGVDESMTMYKSRLRMVLNYYLDSRKVKTFDDLVSLVICDRTKSALSESCLKHVLTVECANRDGWIKPKELSEVVDRYLANFNDGKPNALSAKMNVPKVNSFCSSDYKFQRQKFEPNAKAASTSVTQPVTEKKSELVVRPNIQCYHCKGPHLKKFCPELRDVNGAKRVNACHSLSLNQQKTVELPAGGRVPESGAASADVSRHLACREHVLMTQVQGSQKSSQMRQVCPQVTRAQSTRHRKPHSEPDPLMASSHRVSTRRCS
jgi:hypothetical protein